MTSKSAAAPASFHSSGKTPSASSSASFVVGLDLLRRRHRVALAGCGERLPQLGDERVDSPHRDGVARDEHALEVGDRLRGAVAERDRLLDLEGHRDAPVRDAALVLDRDEREEAKELAGAPDLLLARERRGPEAFERRVDRGAGLGEGAPVGGERSRDEAVEVGRGARAAAASRCRSKAGRRIAK